MKYPFKIITCFWVLFLLSSNLTASEYQYAANNKIIRIPLLTAHLEKEKSIERIEIKRIDFSPLQKTGYHLHPCPVVGYIVKGSIYFQIEGKKSKILNEGDAFFEPANARMLHFDNISKTKGATFITFYLLGASDEKIIKMLNSKLGNTS